MLATTSLYSQEKKVTIKGKLTQTSNYCGGAAPSDEMLMEYATPKPYAFKTLYVRKGDVNDLKKPIVMKFRSDANGMFSFQLPAGVYSIIQENQAEELDLKKIPTGHYLVANEKCLKEWWAKPLYLLKVTEDKEIEINFHHPCFVPGDMPCLTYVGPYPP